MAVAVIWHFCHHAGRCRNPMFVFFALLVVFVHKFCIFARFLQ